MAFAEPGGGQQAEQQAEGEQAREQREQAHALDVIGVALVQPEPIVAVQDLSATQHDEPRPNALHRAPLGNGQG